MQVLHRPSEPARLTRWDEKAGLHGMRYAPNDRRAFKHKKRRPAMKKISTVQVFGNEILKEQKLTIGVDLGDRWSFYCVLEEAGKIILEQKVPTTPEAMKQTFSRIPHSRIALETGTHSPWVSRLFCSFKISFPYACTVLIFFIAGLLFLYLKARRLLGA